MSQILKEKLSAIPSNPGVYFFKDKKNDIIYIGKAKSLKKRVRSYFNKSNHDIKTSVMVKHIFDIDFLVVKNEAEALITESNLIKINKPRYNVYLKDDKTYPYMKITKEKYPKLEIVRFKNFNKDNHLYFGPYTRSKELRGILKLLHKIFPIKTCDDKKNITCFCGFCLSEQKISEYQYNEIIKKVVDFLKGKTDNVAKYLDKKMNEMSIKLEYEKAANIRDQILLIKNFYKTENHQKTQSINRDIIGVASEGSIGVVTLIKYRNTKLISNQTFEINTSDDIKNNIFGFLKQYYFSTNDIPQEIIIQEKIINQSDIQNWLEAFGKKIPKIIVPQIGNKRKNLNLCIENSLLKLNRILESKKRRKEFVSKMVLALQKDLLLDVPPRRIEGFDNSNLNGTYPVSSMVCFIDGQPKKSQYRKFKLRNIKGIDDFASMREVIFRRYKRVLEENLPLPDLILVDGGKGQLSSAKGILDSLGLSFIPVIGLAKKMEEVYKPEFSEPQSISKTSPGLVLLKQIRDESHRFAITFHRLLRDKGMFK